MGYDGKILARARDRLAERRRQHSEALAARQAEVALRAPGVFALDAELTRLMTELAADALRKSVDAGAAVLAAQEQSARLLERRAALLAEAGLPADYLDERCDCPACRDSGYVLGRPCACLDALCREETVRELSSILKLSGQSFARFDLNYYDRTPDPETGLSPYQTMHKVLGLCRDYAEDFNAASPNLLFRGGTGLGKTFLSAAIAGVVSEKGFSVVYDSAVAIMEAFERQKFDRGGEDAEAVSARVRRYMDCDLLILDDLGTEMTTQFTQSALYALVNGRLLRGGRTVITTNLREDELHRRYSPQIVSRLEGEYLVLGFVGRDIRKLRRERGL